MYRSSHAITVDELDASGRKAVMVGFLWRGFVVNLLVVAGSSLGGFLVGFLFNVGMTVAGIKPEPALKNLVVALSAVAGFSIGLYGLWQYIRWLFRVQFAGYHLRLVPAYVGSPDAADNAL
jgi:hypothetical protein